VRADVAEKCCDRTITNEWKCVRDMWHIDIKFKKIKIYLQSLLNQLMIVALTDNLVLLHHTSQRMNHAGYIFSSLI
jgi:hypothetical protein